MNHNCVNVEEPQEHSRGRSNLRVSKQSPGPSRQRLLGPLHASLWLPGCSPGTPQGSASSSALPCRTGWGCGEPFLGCGAQPCSPQACRSVTREEEALLHPSPHHRARNNSVSLASTCGLFIISFLKWSKARQANCAGTLRKSQKHPQESQASSQPRAAARCVQAPSQGSGCRFVPRNSPPVWAQFHFGIAGVRPVSGSAVATKLS